MSSIPVLDAVLGASLEVMPLNIFPVPAKFLDCVDEDLVLELSISQLQFKGKQTPLAGSPGPYICISPFATVKIWIERLLPSFRAF